jgi:hypothetical protein
MAGGHQDFVVALQGADEPRRQGRHIVKLLHSEVPTDRLTTRR